MNKPGWKTSEFWLIVATHILNFVIMADFIDVESFWYKVVSFAVTALATAGYTYGRSLIKSA